MTASPSRTLTFVFTDIEGSTRMLRSLGDAYAGVLREHDAIIRSAVEAHGGTAFGSEGDAQHLVFGEADQAIAAAVQAQRDLAAQDWPDGHPVRVRMGIHAGRATVIGDEYGGLTVHETARIASAGHGGQVIVSAAVHELVPDLPEGVSCRDLGEHRLKDFDEPVHLFQLDIVGLDHEFPPLRAQSVASARYLPTPLTEFVGRQEVEQVRAALAAARVVTLTGPGGTGKTRLAIEVAADAADEHADGTVFVALDAVSDPDLVASEITTALGLTTGTDAPADRLVGYLAERDLLLVLDNIEQVIDAGSLVARLLRETRQLRVLVTSRIPLRIYGEREIPVPALSLPPTENGLDADQARRFEAVRLFEARAAASRPGFEIEDGDVATVIDIVRRLDGLPLAIELATARLRMLPLEALRSRLDDRLGTLTGGARDLPDRQRTLRGAIAWSHDLLDEPDQQLFARMGVFAGSAELELLERVCGPAEELGRAVFDGIDSLTLQSLVFLAGDGGTEPRFGMLATIREFARERLTEAGQLPAMQRRHAEAHLELAEAAAPELLGTSAREWNARLELAHDDFRAALDRIVEAGDAELGSRMIAALWRFWQVRGHLHEGAARAARVLALPGMADLAPALVARAETAAGGISYWRSDPPSTYRHYSAALRHARASGDKALIAEALYDHGFAPDDHSFDQVDRYRYGKPMFEAALELYRELDDRAGEASALWALHQVAEAEGDAATSERLALETLGLSRALGDPFRTGWAAYTLGILYAGERRLQEALMLLEESLDVFVATVDATGILFNLASIAFASLDGVDADAGWRLLGAARRMQEETGASLLQENIYFYADNLRREPATEAEHRLVAEGHDLSREEAVELARRLSRQGAAGR